MAKLTTVPFSGYYDYGHGFDDNENREKYILRLIIRPIFCRCVCTAFCDDDCRRKKNVLTSFRTYLRSRETFEGLESSNHY
jgi:hypothetical protein